MELQSKNPRSFGLRMIVDQLHRGDAVNLVDLPISHRDDRQLIPVSIDELLIFVADFTNHLGVAIGIHNHPLKAFCNNPSPLFRIEHSEELRLTMQIGLVTFNGKIFRLANPFASVLHPRVISFKADLRFEDKVFDFSSLPDQKGVALRWLVFCRLAKDRAILNRPELCLPGPSRKILSVEERLEFLSVAGSRKKRKQNQDRKRFHGLNHVVKPINVSR